MTSYWRESGVPWPAVWSAFVGPGVAMSVQWRNGTWEHAHVFPTGEAFAQWVAANSDALGELHVDPAPDRFLILDLDLRSIPSAATITCDRKHPVCRQCWPLVNEAVAHVEAEVRRTYLPESQGLVVFTGNNGVHVWYPAMTREEQYSLAQTTVRENFLKALSKECRALIDPKPLTPWHEIRLSFSLHMGSGRGGTIVGFASTAPQLPFPEDVPLATALLLLERMHRPAPSLIKDGNPRLLQRPAPVARAPAARRRAPIAIATEPAAPLPMVSAPWSFLRIAKLAPATAKVRYGVRCCVPVQRLLDRPLEFLRTCSLIIPCVTAAGNIPSRKELQGAFDDHWHLRYFGLLDLDTSFEHPGGDNNEPLFTDMPNEVLPSGDHEVKMLFARRLRDEKLSFGQMAERCPRFGRLLALAEDIAPTQASVIVFFSGGAGFRVLFETPRAWRLVRWGDSPGYAKTLVEQRILQDDMLADVGLGAELRQRLDDYIDENVYHKDKGIKPDVHAHFETNMWPQRIRSRDLKPGEVGEDRELSASIASFWARVLAGRPQTMDECVGGTMTGAN